MSWTDFYQRRDAINLVLDQASRNPSTGLSFTDLPMARAQFDSEEQLALALQYKWSQLLLGRIGVALVEAEHDEDADNLEAVAAAWRRAATEAPVLRELLDGYVEDAGPEFQAALAAEQRMVAYAAGLAEPGEAAEQTARVGSAFLALIRGRSARPTRRGNPIEQLLRRLVASA
ncbi:MAG TPA: hypothetical protein VHX38_08925 [Pseudonocardiaceae bacterium]|jgi:hypothetical protein|nr:hypothetical protein [Pseudonocardiaceae bacterium]